MTVVIPSPEELINQNDCMTPVKDEFHHVEKDGCDIASEIAGLAFQNGLSGLKTSSAKLQTDVVESRFGVVASDDVRCSEVGVEILKRGGHAVDAAIATALCLGVVSPTESGIGGGGFMVVRCGLTGAAHALDMRETAPAAAHKDMYDDNPEAQVEGPLSIAVPGELVGLHRAWRMYGRLPWRTLFQPAINYAKNGFQVYPYLANDLKEFEDKVMADPGLKHVFAPHDKILEAYETCYNKKLGETLEAVSRHGPGAIYKGLIGKKLVKDVRDKGGILTVKDLNNYKVKMTDVVEADVLGYKILGMPPPSAGTVGLTMVAHVLENYQCTEALKGPLGLHRLTEAMKHMIAKKMNLGDPGYHHGVRKYAKLMMSHAFAKKIWGRIDDNRTFPPGYYENRWRLVIDNGTSHLGVIDAARNAVAFTTSVNDQFGSKILSPSTGIVLNNQMRDFSTPAEELTYLIKEICDTSRYPDTKQDDPPPAIANLIEPGKRPLSSMTPLIMLKDGHLAGVIGGSGGPNIIAAVTQVFLKHMIFQENPRPSVRQARLYPKLLDTDLDYGDLTTIDHEHIELSKDDRDFLTTRGHNMTVVGFAASCHLIVQDLNKDIELASLDPPKIGMLTGVGDPRKDAKPAGL